MHSTRDFLSLGLEPTNRIELLFPDYETGVVTFDTTLAYATNNGLVAHLLYLVLASLVTRLTGAVGLTDSCAITSALVTAASDLVGASTLLLLLTLRGLSDDFFQISLILHL